MLPLTEEDKKYCKQKFCPKIEFNNYGCYKICILKFETSVILLKNIGALHTIFVTEDTKLQNKFLWYFIMVFNYNYLFIIKRLMEEFKGQFEYLRKITVVNNSK